MNNTILNKIYIDNNYPGLTTLYKIVKSIYPDFTKKDIKQFHESRIGVQLLKKQSKKKNDFGTITATYVNEMWNLDICDMTEKFSRYNSNYRYILTAIDIFSRRGFCEPMKNKNLNDCINAFNKMISGQDKPITIFSDNDSVFLSNEFTKMLRDHNIIQNANTKDDHRALGVLDAFTKKIKLALTHRMLESGLNNWIKPLPEVLYNYNNKIKHPALNNITPSKAQKNNSMIFDINSEKGKMNNMTSDLHIGCIVRINIAGKFSKSNDLQFSSDVFTVVGIYGSNITLDNNKTYKRDKLLDVTGIVPQNNGNKISSAYKNGRIDRFLQQEGVDKSNIVKSKKVVSKILKDGGIDSSNIITTKRIRK